MKYLEAPTLTREMTMELIEFVTIDKYRSKKDPIPREFHIYYKLIDDLENLDFKRNFQKQDRLQFVFTTADVYSHLDFSSKQKSAEIIEDIFKFGDRKSEQDLDAQIDELTKLLEELKKQKKKEQEQEQLIITDTSVLFYV